MIKPIMGGEDSFSGRLPSQKKTLERGITEIQKNGVKGSLELLITIYSSRIACVGGTKYYTSRLIHGGARIVAKKRINSRMKGCVGEREWRDFLRGWGLSARRGQQYSGANGDADVVCEKLPFHWEVKRVQNLNLTKALAQANDDLKTATQYPVIAHRRNGEKWMLTWDAKDFFIFLQEYTSLLLV